jgi:phenylpropionate dioxygenase-like ring-hydroxylating dioxygenase large terminal subunit
MWDDIGPVESSGWSEQAYRRLLPPVGHLDKAGQRRWLYFKLWPNVAFDIYPDQVDFMQFLPISATETVIREISYALPDDRREMRAARYLNWRINRQVNAEDTALVAQVQAGTGSGMFRPGPLGEGEVCLRAFASRLRTLIPQARAPAPPPACWFANGASLRDKPRR